MSNINDRRKGYTLLCAGQIRNIVGKAARRLAANLKKILSVGRELFTRQNGRS